MFREAAKRSPAIAAEVGVSGRGGTACCPALARFHCPGQDRETGGFRHPADPASDAAAWSRLLARDSASVVWWPEAWAGVAGPREALAVAAGDRLPVDGYVAAVRPMAGAGGPGGYIQGAPDAVPNSLGARTRGGRGSSCPNSRLAKS